MIGNTSCSLQSQEATRSSSRSRTEKKCRERTELLQHWGSMHFNPPETPPCGIAPPRNVTHREELKPLFSSPELVPCLSLDLKEQLTAINVHTQTTGDSSHKEKRSSNRGSKISFPQEITQASSVHCPRPLGGKSSYLKLTSSAYMARHNAILTGESQLHRV